MSLVFDDEQVVPDLELGAINESPISSQSSSVSSDSDSLSSQSSPDHSLPAHRVMRSRRRSLKRLESNCSEKISLTDTKAAVFTMQRLAGIFFSHCLKVGYLW